MLLYAALQQRLQQQQQDQQTQTANLLSLPLQHTGWVSVLVLEGSFAAGGPSVTASDVSKAYQVSSDGTHLGLYRCSHQTLATALHIAMLKPQVDDKRCSSCHTAYHSTVHLV